MEEIQKTYRQENKIRKTESTYIGSILLIVSAFLPCLDRILVWIWPILDESRDTRGVPISTDIWIASVYLAPVFIIIAAFFRPNYKIYTFPLVIFFYSAVVYYAPIFGYDVKFLRWNSWLALLASIIAGVCLYFVLKHVRWVELEENASDDFYDDVLEKFEKLNEENKNLRSQIKSQEHN
ncbi:hypothetical protein [Chryseobacterium rhizosphaerae]|uniref:hypothetical protein n=1 Tax=Chryseobacterium rhizosphaerae TaxID=395937 RepID=UPI003D0A6E6B